MSPCMVSEARQAGAVRRCVLSLTTQHCSCLMLADGMGARTESHGSGARRPVLATFPAGADASTPLRLHRLAARDRTRRAWPRSSPCLVQRLGPWRRPYTLRQHQNDPHERAPYRRQPELPLSVVAGDGDQRTAFRADGKCADPPGHDGVGCRHRHYLCDRPHVVGSRGGNHRRAADRGASARLHVVDHVHERCVLLALFSDHDAAPAARNRA